jgi:hypothetical protein
MKKRLQIIEKTLLILLLCVIFDNVVHCQDSNQDTILPKIIELPQGCKLVLDPNIDLVDTVSIEIVNGICNILPQVQKLIPVDSVTINLAISSKYILPIWGVGGRTISDDSGERIEFYFDPKHPNFKVEYILRSLVHEFHHVCRVRMPDFQVTILECMVNEGLADKFMVEVLHCEKTPWSSALTEEQIQQYMIRVKPVMREKFESWTKELDVWMLYGKPEPDPIPGWTGYSIGWRIVENYLITHPEAKASLLVFTSPEIIVSATPELTVDNEK